MARAPHLPIAAALALVALAGCGQPRATSVAPGEPAPYPEHYAHSIAALGWPGATRAFQVGHGSQVSNGECTLEWRLVSATGPVACSPVAFERDGVPVAHWTMVAPGQRVDFEAAAAPGAAFGDTGLVLSVRATPHASAGAAVVLETRLGGVPEGPHAVPWDAPTWWSFAEAWRGHDALRDGRLVASVDDRATFPAGAPGEPAPAHVEGESTGALSARCSTVVAAGAPVAWTFWMPLYPLAAGARPTAGEVAHERVAAEARRAWRATLARATTLRTPDARVEAAWRAALVTLVQCQERHQGRWAPIGSPFQYRDVWLRDGARVVRALALAGLADYAGDDARSLARFQLPPGVLISQRGQLDGTGQALWAFEQASALAGDAALARELAPVAERAVGWIERQDAATRQLGLAWPGLLPYGDPHDGELVRAQLVGNDAWAIAGCAAAAALARRAGDDALAARADAAAAAHRAAFAAALARVRGADLPPSWQGAGRDWGNVVAAYPTGALPAGDPRVAALARRLRARGGDSGLTCYGPDDSLHTYLAADLAQTDLLAGSASGARVWLDGLLDHSSSTLGQAEIFSRRDGGFGGNLPPHATAAAALVDLLRDMVACEVGDTLAVALGADVAWWSGTRLERAPTRFGTTTVALERPDAATLRVRVTPAVAPLRVRVPDGLRAISAAGARVVDGRWVEAPKGTAELRIAVAPAGDAR